jgi:hypothetical protein
VAPRLLSSTTAAGSLPKGQKICTSGKLSVLDRRLCSRQGASSAAALLGGALALGGRDLEDGVLEGGLRSPAQCGPTGVSDDLAGFGQRVDQVPKSSTSTNTACDWKPRCWTAVCGMENIAG